MSMMRKAQRRKSKLRLGISGPAGSGKTFSSLLMAYGITGDWDKICLIDTENGSGDLYAGYNQDGIEIGEFNIISLSAPYTPEKYTAAIKDCEVNGIECIVIDSLSHAWSGEGGLLDKKGQIETSGKPGVNSWTAWRDITPMHNRLVESILSSKCHVIATLRAKMDYVQEKDGSGKTVIRKVGMNPIQRDGMEYEFTIFMDINQDHNASASKDRTSLFDGKVWRPGVDTGRQLLDWLEIGVDAPKPMRNDQHDKINELRKGLKMNGTVITNYCQQSFGTASPNEQQADEVIEWLEAALAASSETEASA